MKLVLLRHGESEWNLENRFTGWTDVELSDNGRKEALSAGRLCSTADMISIFAIHLILNALFIPLTLCLMSWTGHGSGYKII